MVSESDVRTVLKIQNTTILTSAEIALAITDAASLSNTGDEIANRFYAAYLLASQISWDKVKSTGDGTVFEPPKPEKFFKIYKQRLGQIGTSVPRKINADTALNGLP